MHGLGFPLTGAMLGRERAFPAEIPPVSESCRLPTPVIAMCLRVYQESFSVADVAVGAYLLYAARREISVSERRVLKQPDLLGRAPG